MNVPKILVWVAALFFCVAWWSVFWSLLLFAVLLAVSMVLVVVAGYLDHDGPDYDETSLRSQQNG